MHSTRSQERVDWIATRNQWSESYERDAGI